MALFVMGPFKGRNINSNMHAVCMVRYVQYGLKETPMKSRIYSAHSLLIYSDVYFYLYNFIFLRNS